MNYLIFKHLLPVLLFVFSVKALAYNAMIDGIYYNFNGTKATVTCLYYQDYSNRNAYKGNVIIPESVIHFGTTYSVTTIGEYNQEIKGETNVEIIPVSA